MNFLSRITIAIILFLSAGSAIAHEIETGDDKITCEIERLTPEEHESLFFSKEASDYCNMGTLGYADMQQLADYNWMRNMSAHVQAYKVTVKNNSNKEIILYKDEYLSSLVGTIMSPKTLADNHYPDFKKGVKGWGLGALISGGITALGLCIAAAAANGGSHDSRAAMGVALLASLATGSISYLFWQKRSKAKKMENKRLELKNLCPSLKESGHRREQLDDDEAFTLSPGSTFTETILIDTHAMQTTMALLGNTKTELVYAVDDE